MIDTTLALDYTDSAPLVEGWLDTFVVEGQMDNCECGCDEVVKGRFKRGHQIRGKSGADHPNWKGGVIKLSRYLYEKRPGHPSANSEGYVLQHRLIAEKAIGKYLPEGAEVHHVNGNGFDNRPENLVACQDQSYHMLLHRRQRALDACGNPNWVKCRICLQYDDPANMAGWKRPCHRECFNEYLRNHRAMKKLEAN
jgi:hypothetical protein